MSKKSKITNLNSILEKNVIPKLINGTNVGFDVSELKKTSTIELKNILKLIIMYFNNKKRQKIYNSKYKTLFQRVKQELKDREESFKKNNNMILKKITIKKTSIEELKIPEFFNDRFQFITYSNNINSFILNFFEFNLKKEIEKLKIEKETLLNEIYNIKKYSNVNDNNKIY